MVEQPAELLNAPKFGRRREFFRRLVLTERQVARALMWAVRDCDFNTDYRHYRYALPIPRLNAYERV